MSSDSDDYVMSDIDDIADYNVINGMDALKSWLKPTDYDGEGSEYRRHLASHTAGTNRWLLSVPEWKEWHDTVAHGFLRLTGIPGSGKSVLAAHLVHQLGEEGVPVLYFFFRQIIDANHSPRALLRDWLTQILPFSLPLQAEIDTLIESSRRLDTVSMDDLWRLLRIGLSDQPRVYAVADALDEMDAGNDDFLHALAELGRWKPATVKVLVTSRPVPVVDVAFRQVTKLQVRLEEAYVDVDIAQYVSQRLQGSGIDHEDQGLIRSAVPGRANGLFLYARLAMDGFLEPTANVHDVLRHLPLDLNCMYTDLLKEHARRSGAPLGLQLRVLQWVTHASRPLRLLELSEVIHSRAEYGSGRDLGSTKALVRSSCGPLIEMLPDETLSVCHHSLTEFLKGWTRSNPPQPTPQPFPILWPAQTHLGLAVDCLSYLSNGCLDSCKLWSNEDEMDARVFGWSTQSHMQMDHPFSTYAATNWYVHATKAIEHGISELDMARLNDAIDSVLKSENWRRILLQLDERSSQTEGVKRLHIAAWAGLEAYAERVLEEGEPLNSRDEAGNTALYWAASYGKPSVASLLLKRGAKPDTDNKTGLKPLHEASSKGHAAVVSLLLQAGVNPMTRKTKENPGRRCGNARRTVGDTPLMYACQNGHADAVSAYLPFLQPEQMARALEWAATSGKNKVVTALVQQPGFDVDVRVDGRTALLIACQHRKSDIINTLLQRGADPNALCERRAGQSDLPAKIPRRNVQDDERGSTPMHAFGQNVRHPYRSWEECEDPEERDAIMSALDALISAGGSVETLDERGETILHHACANSGQDSPSLWIAILTRLLDAGADANLRDMHGQTPLHSCLNDTTGQGLRLLVERGGADINSADSKGCVPLLSLLDDSGNSPVVLSLLELHPDCNVVDSEGNTPLHLALRGGNPRAMRRRTQSRKLDGHPLTEQVVAALLAAGADPRARNLQGETPLHLFALSGGSGREEPDYSGDRRIIMMLLAKGADLEAKDHLGQTILYRNAKVRSTHWTNKMDFLLNIGCDVHTTDFGGRGILHEIVRWNSETGYLEFFISRGADKNLRDHKGNTILHEAAISSQYHNVRAYYESSGISPDLRNHAGQTPLSIASGVVPGWQKEKSPFHVFLDICDDKNTSDNRGVRPIHMASCVSEAYVTKLLDAGASISAITNEGLNTLHIAARARQSNIVGLLCDLILASQEQEVRSMIDATDSSGQTPLHHACRSGRPETVAILLQAGASTLIHDKKWLTPFSACAEFEEESILWLDAGSRGSSAQSLHVWDISRDTKDRPKWYTEEGNSIATRKQGHGCLVNEHGTARIGEILDMLVSHRGNGISKLDDFKGELSKAIRRAAHEKLDYTFACFTALGGRLGHPEFVDHPPFDYLSAQYRVAAASKAFQEHTPEKSASKGNLGLSNLLHDRQFGLVEETVKHGDKTSVTTALSLFIEWGYANLVASTAEEMPDESMPDKGMDDENAADEESTDGYGTDEVEDEAEGKQQPQEHKPSLIDACERELPNIEVIRALSRRKGFQVDQRWFKNIYFEDEYQFIHTETALHELAKGVNWWHVAEGIPLLLGLGADINARDEHQRTPLHTALVGDWRDGLYRKRAARLLIERGADVNAVNSEGQPSLAMTEDLDLISLMIERGANHSISALFNAVKHRNPDLLKRLLALGVDPNHRLRFDTGLDKYVERLNWLHANQNQRDLTLPHSEHCVLYFAATRRVDTGHRGTKIDHSIDEDLVRILLAHGADPYRRFKQIEREQEPGSKLKFGMSRIPDVVGDDQNVTEHILVHQVLYDKGRFQPFLELPDLNLEMRDSHGRTLLLVACYELGRAPKAASSPDGELPPTIAEQLIQRGADLAAIDDEGNNALHTCLDARVGGPEDLVTLIAGRASHLAQQTNSHGETPFHLVLKTRSLPLINLLLPLCADTRTPDAKGNTALHHIASHMARMSYYKLDRDETDEAYEARLKATSEGHVALLQRFLSDGIDINTRNHAGQTPVFLFVKGFVTRNDDVGAERLEPGLAVLSAAGADPRIPDASGNSPLHVVAAKGLDSFERLRSDGNSTVVNVFKRLVELGLDPFAEDEKSRTSLDVAAANGNAEILALFEKEK